MNFTYDGANLSEIIKNYYKNGNNYTVFYLDGSRSDYISCRDDEENRIKKLMIDQALKRSEELDSNNESLFKSANLAIALLLSASMSLPQVNKNEWLSLLTIFAIILSVKNFRSEKVRANELKKYKLFFELMEDIDNVNNSDILKSIEFDKYYQERVDINTLDNYSYGDIKKLYKSYKNKK